MNMSKSIFIGIAIGLLAVIVTPSVMIAANASIEQNSTSADSSGIPNGSSSHFPIPPDTIEAALGHINNAQTALQNGDTEGANNHLDLAKQSLEVNFNHKTRR